MVKYASILPVPERSWMTYFGNITMKSAAIEDTVPPRDHVTAWISIHQDTIGSAPIKFERRDEPARTLVVWFETRKYLIDISAWDHACWLDILVLNKTTGETDYTLHEMSDHFAVPFLSFPRPAVFRYAATAETGMSDRAPIRSRTRSRRES